MEIRIPTEMEDLFQEAVAILDSYTDPDEPKNLRENCQNFLKNLSGKVRDCMETSYYLAFALFGQVKLANEKKCLMGLCDGTLPSWDDVQIKKPAIGFVTEIRDLDDDLAKQIVVVAFLLSRADNVVRADNSNFERSERSQDTEDTATEVDELTEGGEEDDDYSEE